MKNLGIFSLKVFFFGWAFLGIARQGICSCICFVLAVIDLEVITRKFSSPADLFGAQVFCIYETTKIIVMGEDEDLIFAAF